MKGSASSKQDSLSGVTAAVLAGGMGTRLQPVVSDRPKVLAEIHGRPCIAYLLDQLAEAGIRRAVLCTGYKGEQIEQALGDAFRGLELAYSREPSPLGTGGALRFALPQLQSPTVLVMNGDSYCAADLRSFWSWHRSAGFSASLLLTRVDDTSRFGRVQTDQTGRVLQFEEKGGRAGPGWINAGVYLLGRHLLQEIPENRAVSLERDLLPLWVASGVRGQESGVRGQRSEVRSQQAPRLGGYRCESRFLDIGTPDSYAAAEAFFAPPPPEGCHAPRRSPAFPKSRASHGTHHAERDGYSPRFVLLDRDGTIIVERHYLSDPDQVELLPGAAAGLRRHREMGLKLAVVTNQSGIARGYLDAGRLGRIHERLRSLLRSEGVELDGIYVCPHHPDDGCACRKPRPALVHRAARELGFRPADSFVIGDKPCDVDLGRAVGARTILVRTGYGRTVANQGACRPDHIADDLLESASIIEHLLAAHLRSSVSAGSGEARRAG